MLSPDSCNYSGSIALLDYAYLALNVYHTPKDNKLLGFRPQPIKNLQNIKQRAQYNTEGWYQLQTEDVFLPTTQPFYADVYVKIYRNKIRHIMLAMRGTVPSIAGNISEDVKTWWKAVVSSNQSILNEPSFYTHQLSFFLVNFDRVVGRLSKLNLIADDCAFHATGHSLGGALANLVSAAAIPVSAQPFTVISFNAPGIASMQGVSTSAFREGQVISMRATYDFVSAISEPYGYVINIKIPQHYTQAKQAFAIEAAKNSEGHRTFKQTMCDAVLGCDTYQRLEQASDLYDSLLAQHSMDNFIHVIAQNPSVASRSFIQLIQWAQNHGGMNHNETAMALLN